MVIPGGWTDVDLSAAGAVANVRQVVDSVRAEIAKSLDIKLTDYEVTSARTQVVAGTNYAATLSSGGKSYEVTVFVPLPGSGKSNQLMRAQELVGA